MATALSIGFGIAGICALVAVTTGNSPSSEAPVGSPEARIDAGSGIGLFLDMPACVLQKCARRNEGRPQRYSVRLWTGQTLDLMT